MKQFAELNAVAGDTVMVVADCQMRGARIVVPHENKTNIIAGLDGGYVAIENRDGKVRAWHTGYCCGDPDQWAKAS